jgi:D-3-phosphoglycerate dehydrogenase
LRDNREKTEEFYLLYKAIILVLEPFEAESHRLLEAVGEVRFGPRNRAYSEKELITEVSDVSALVITSRDSISKQIIDSAKFLKIIAKCGSKPSNVDIDAATRRRVPVTWTPGANPVSVAEHTVALMLALLKKVFLAMTSLRQGEWRKESVKTLELSGKTVGIIGLGHIGFEVAKLLKNFGCNLVYFDPYISGERGDKIGVQKIGLNELLERADIVTLHCQLNAETRHMIGENQLRRMKNTAYLVNTARGSLVDERALVKALEKGQIAGAGIDVFDEEPVRPTNPLLSLDNVVVTPHMAAWSREAPIREAIGAAEEVIRVLRGETPTNVVNPECLGKR